MSGRRWSLIHSFRFGAGVGVALADRMPRRLALVWGSLGCAAMLAINGALSRKWAHTPADQKDLAVGKGVRANSNKYEDSFH